MAPARLLLATAPAAVLSGALAVAVAAGPASPAAVPAARPAGHLTLTAAFLSRARAALVRDLGRQHGTAWFVPGRRRPAAAGATAAESTYNWAGYADAATAGGTFTKVSGSWTVPALTCTREDRITSDWVGLDGFASPTVEQDGTVAQCFEGRAVYYSWYEMYPAGTVEAGQTVAAGDKISASVRRSGTRYTLALTDPAHPASSFSKKASCAVTTCLDTSAEWIAERPSYAIGIAPEAQFASVPFSKASATARGKTSTISGYSGTRYDITSVDATGSYDIAVASGLTGGNAFTARWKNSY